MRRSDREITAPEQIREILERARILRLGLFDEGYPYVVPLHYGYVYENGRLTFYLHSAQEGHKLDLLARNPHVCVELDCDVELVSGGDNACRYGSRFASIIGQGTAALVTDASEKRRGLSLLMEAQTGRQFSFTDEQCAHVAVIRVMLDTFSAKARR